MTKKQKNSFWEVRNDFACISTFIAAAKFAALLFIPLLFLAGCGTSSNLTESAETASSGKDYFSEKIQIHHAKGFTIEYHDNFKVINILSPFEKSTDTAKYVLLQRGTKKPKGYPNSQFIEIPIRSLVAMSSMHVGLVGLLGEEKIVTGLGNLKYVSNPEIIKQIEAGKIAEVGKDQGLNEEKLITMHPDLIMTTGSPVSKMERYTTLNAAGIPVLINSEWVETTPLGRAEWVKLLAALLNREDFVNKKFAKMEEEYKRLAALSQKVKAKPSIITGMNSKDSWFVPNGNSYMAQFFRDAGADYHWNNTKATGSLALNFEAVYPIALTADYWLNVGISNYDNKKEILAKDPRYTDFKAYKSGQIYSYNKRVNNRGSNDYWESGAVNPQIVLSDLIKILHPELLPEHELVYYKQVN
ncbi:iron complex transport system substrate-binding protein [Dyadobacter koreensis]|uniref:Iron complex transport system substrate-binding protein n=1 Tax=Dyadobacter koreensis TaxID=408657 RepID=A0A1H6WP38_9BACT|nr:ABC transporter substrate-binding protein [Dyadobacter koreensis]SEJ18648.1 iron complex transport system substrate-binding protein [Dyadobacter koreensis]